MSLTIDDPETVAAIRRLAEESQQSVEDVLRDAVEAAERTRAWTPTTSSAKVEDRERRLAASRQIQAEIAKWPKTGLKADKAFFDSLEG